MFSILYELITPYRFIVLQAQARKLTIIGNDSASLKQIEGELDILL